MIHTFKISPIITITLTTLYVALTLPLPFLAQTTNAPVAPSFLWVAISIGMIILQSVLSEKVVVDDQQIQVTYPQWIPKFWLQGWSLKWSEIKTLKMRTTGQGGLVYYFITHSQDRAYLLPMRIIGFAKMVKIVEEKTGIDTNDIRPLAQPWMYFLMFGFTLLMLLVDGWIIQQSL